MRKKFDLNRTSIGLILSFPLALTACGKRVAPQAESFKTFASHDHIETTPICGAECSKLRQEFRYVVYVGRQIYCYWDLKKQETGTDFNALASKMEVSITDATTQTQYFQTLRRWAAAFHDGHVSAMMKKDSSGIDIYTSPFRLTALASGTDHERIAVSGSKDSRLGIKVGDEVIEINSKPIAQALDDAETLTSGSTRRMRRYFGTRRLVDVLDPENGSVLKLHLKRGTQDFTVDVPRTVELSPMPSGSATEAEATGVENFTVKILPGNVGYLKIDGFSGSQGTYLMDMAMQHLAGTRGLVIDLRSNGGGDQSGSALIARLIQKKVTRYQARERMADFIFANRPYNFMLSWTSGDDFAKWHDIVISPASQQYGAGKPVIALTSPNCFSACDTFTSALKTNQLATIIGEATGGGTGTPLVFDLPISNNQFRYSVVQGMTAKGDPIEGVGTTPDKVIEATLDDLAQNTDSQLVGAIQMLDKSPEVTPNPTVRDAIDSLPRTWDQSLDLSPTRSEQNDLHKILSIDEI